MCSNSAYNTRPLCVPTLPTLSGQCVCVKLYLHYVLMVCFSIYLKCDAVVCFNSTYIVRRLYVFRSTYITRPLNFPIYLHFIPNFDLIRYLLSLKLFYVFMVDKEIYSRSQKLKKYSKTQPKGSKNGKKINFLKIIRIAGYWVMHCG